MCLPLKPLSHQCTRGITPYEAWNGIKPDVSHFRVFGCAAYVHVPEVERHKLDCKARKCVLLGYGANQKGYRLYDVESMKVIHSRDVVFDETSMPGIQKESVVKYVELEINEESSVGTSTHETSGSASDMTTAEGQLIKGSLPINSSSEVALRRSTRNRQQPDRYGHSVSIASTEHTDQYQKQDLPDRLEWENAMETEMRSLLSNKVWELVEPPPNQKIVGSKWVFKQKIDANGIVECYKARLVAQGCTQKFGLDYEETFSAVVRFGFYWQRGLNTSCNFIKWICLPHSYMGN